jgi:hypothetical protein
MTQRWNDLLLAHWPIPATAIAPLLPEDLQVDTFQGSAWLGAVPFWTDRIKLHSMPPIPGINLCPGLNLRTFVYDQRTRTSGIYNFSIDANSLLATALGRFHHQPCHWAETRLEQRSEREFAFYSRRKLVKTPVLFQAQYCGLGPSHKSAECRSGSFEHFMLERYCLFSSNRRGQLLRSNLHLITWPLEEARAVIERNDLAAAAGIPQPQEEPVLHYMRRLAIYIWPAVRVRPIAATRPVTVPVTHPG